MTKTFFTLAALAGALALPAMSAHAQDGTAPATAPQGAMRGPGGPGGGRMMRGGGMMDPGLKGIELTQAQKDSLKAINDRQRAEGQAAMQGANGDREAMRTAMQGMMKKRHDAIRAILTADQQKTYDKNTEEAEKQMKERMKNGGGWGGRGGSSGNSGDAPPPPPPPQG